MSTQTPQETFTIFLICLSSLHPQRLLPSTPDGPLCHSLPLSFQRCLLGFMNFTQHCPSSLTFSCNCQSPDSQQRPPPHLFHFLLDHYTPLLELSPSPFVSSLPELLSVSFSFFFSSLPLQLYRAEIHPLLLSLLAVSILQVSAELNCCSRSGLAIPSITNQADS